MSQKHDGENEKVCHVSAFSCKFSLYFLFQCLLTWPVSVRDPQYLKQGSNGTVQFWCQGLQGFVIVPAAEASFLSSSSSWLWNVFWSICMYFFFFLLFSRVIVIFTVLKSEVYKHMDFLSRQTFIGPPVAHVAHIKPPLETADIPMWDPYFSYIYPT